MPDIAITLQPKQLECAILYQKTGLNAPTMIGYGGSRGGGKSAAIRRIALIMAQTFPGTKSVIIRRTYGDVKANHIDPILTEFSFLREYYSVQNHELRLWNKSVIAFQFAETAADVARKFWGPEYDFVFLDQAEQFSEEEIRQIKTSNRSPGRPPGFAKMGLFFNPGGVGTEFLRRVLWVKDYRDQERSSDYHFIQAYGWDNWQWAAGTGMVDEAAYYNEWSNEERFAFFINETQYGRELNSLPASLRAGHLLGSFESFAGQYFAGVWDESRCILPITQAEQLVQPWWTRWISTDWGFAHYAATYWWAAGKVGPQELQSILGIESSTPVDVVIAHRELVVNNCAEADLAAKIVDMTAANEHVSAHYVSPDAWHVRGSAHCVADQLTDVFARHGFPALERAMDDRVGGWRLMYDGFRRTCQLRANGDEPGVGPMLLISGNCPQLIASIPMLIRDPKKLEDVQKTTTLADDCGDSCRYGYFSYLDPKKQAPRAVRAEQVYNSVESMTAKAMAMRRFEASEKSRKLVARGGNWR